MHFQSEKSFGKLRLRAFQPYHQILCMLKHVKDVEDRSNTPKGCNAMYVEDVEDGKRTYRHTFIIPFLIWYHLNVILCMSKMSKIDQIHLRAVMLCMSKMSKMGKEHTHLSSTSSTCFDIHRILWYGWKALSLSFHIPCTLFELQCRL